VVRLRQGSFEDATSFSDDPVAVARMFAGQGARRLHVVDLDGARVGEPQQREIVVQLLAEVGDEVRIEVAGGLRQDAAVDAMLDAGAARVVLGTVAVRDPELITRVVRAHGSERIVVALDIRQGLAVGEGWRAGAAGRKPEDIVTDLVGVGVELFAVTAIERDGLLTGPDIDLLRRIVDIDRGEVIASGGITSVADLLAVRDAGCTGAIVGRAIYEGRLDLRDAISQLGDAVTG
jgi:phosphoribosylformimino-5-aminoimidazole carboxamide ribotide isomerase